MREESFFQRKSFFLVHFKTEQVLPIVLNLRFCGNQYWLFGYKSTDDFFREIPILASV